MITPELSTAVARIQVSESEAVFLVVKTKKSFGYSIKDLSLHQTVSFMNNY